MKNVIVNVFLIAGIVGLIIGYPELAYVSGLVKIWACIFSADKGKQTSKLISAVAIVAGLGFASMSPFSWWQGILIGFTFVGIVMMILSPFSKRRNKDSTAMN
jgi:predicted membrane protein